MIILPLPERCVGEGKMKTQGRSRKGRKIVSGRQNGNKTTNHLWCHPVVPRLLL